LKDNRRFGGTYHHPLKGRIISRARNRALLATCFHATFLLGLFFNPEERGDIFLRNVGLLSTALYPTAVRTPTPPRPYFTENGPAVYLRERRIYVETIRPRYRTGNLCAASVLHSAHTMYLCVPMVLTPNSDYFPKQH
jgi:hypothetical protein